MNLKLLSVSATCSKSELNVAFRQLTVDVFKAFDSAPGKNRSPLVHYLLFLTAILRKGEASKGKINYHALKHVFASISFESDSELDEKLFKDFAYICAPTLREGVSTHIISGSLATWVDLILMWGTWSQFRNALYLTYSNAFQLGFESVGLSCMFDEYAKEMREDGTFTLRQK